MTFSIIHRGYELNKIEKDFINSTLIDNWNLNRSKKKSIAATDEKLLLLKKARLELFAAGLVTAKELSNKKEIKENIYCLYNALASDILDADFWEKFFLAVADSGFEFGESSVPTYLFNTIRMTKEEYDYVFSKDWDLDDEWQKRIKFLILNL